MFLSERELLMELEKKTHEMIHELERRKDKILSELSGVDKVTLTKLREIIADFYNAKEDIATIAEHAFTDFENKIIKARSSAEKDFDSNISKAVSETIENSSESIGIKVDEFFDEIKQDFTDELSSISLSMLNSFMTSVEETTENFKETVKAYLDSQQYELLLDNRFEQINNMFAAQGQGITVLNMRLSRLEANGLNVSLSDQQLNAIIDEVVESQKKQFVESVDECVDTSKHYVLPDGYVYSYRKKFVIKEHNANDGTGYINQTPSGTWGNTSGTRTGGWTSPLIPIDPTKIAPVGNNAESRVTISGIEKVVPFYNGYSVVVYYYKQDGSQMYMKTNTDLASINKPVNTEISVPFTFNLRDTALFNDTNWATVYGVRISLGISSTSISEDDVKNIKVNMPVLNVEEEVTDWFSTGISYVQNDDSEIIEEIHEDLELLTNKVGEISNKTDTVWYAVGDSITKGYGVGADNCWVNHVMKLNGYDEKLSKNLGISGLGFAKLDPNYGKNARSVIAENDFTNVDLVTVAIGINDWKEVFSIDTVKSEMRYCFDKILNDNPYCKIIFIAPFNIIIKGTAETNWALGYSGSDVTGGTLQQFIDIQKSICEEYNIQVIDLNKCSVFNKVNLPTILSDGLHPDTNCHKAIAKELSRKITFA